MDKIGTTNVNKDLLDAFSYYNDKKAASVLKSVITEGRRDRATNLHWSAVRSGAEAMTFDELTRVVRAFNDNHLEIKTEKLPQAKKNGVQTPLTDPAFLHSLAHHFEDSTALHEQLQLLHSQCLEEKGFLKKNFNIFSSKDPLATVMHDVEQFEEYCRKNHISFDAETQQLQIKDRPKDLMQKMKDNKLLVAAVGGALAGSVGIDPAAGSALAGLYPTLFFSTALPWFVVPFTGLSIFKMASDKNAAGNVKALPLAVGSMVMAAAISLTVFNVQKDLGMIHRPQESVEQKKIEEKKDQKPKFDTAIANEIKDNLSFFIETKPSEYLLYLAALSLALGIRYKPLRNRMEGDDKPTLSTDFEKVTHFSGNLAIKAGNAMNKAFVPMINYGLPPAVALSLSNTVANHGIEHFGQYGQLYASTFGAMFLTAGVICGALYKMGIRSKEDWQAVAEIAKTAGTSRSGTATIPVIKQSLEKVGVPEHVRNLAEILTQGNMTGPMACLGNIVLVGNEMFGNSQTMPQQLATLGTVFVQMLSVRGIPASNVTLLSPIMEKQGLDKDDVNNLYSAILGPDDPLDRVETIVNTGSDFAIAYGLHKYTEWKEKRDSSAPAP